MTYCTHFYAECPATAMEIEIEIIFNCEEEEEQEMFWGFPVSMPGSGEVEILKVWKNGEEWLGYSESITMQLHDYDWERCRAPKKQNRPSISKPIKLIPCKRQSAA